METPNLATNTINAAAIDPATVITGVLTAGKLADALSKMAKMIPDFSVPQELKDKHRSMVITVHNETQFDLVYDSDYFYTGRYWTGATNVPAFHETIFSACNGDGTILQGVSAGAGFHLRLPTKSGSTKLPIGVGFENPEWGSFSASAVFGSAKSAQGALATHTMTATSCKYAAINTDGKNVHVQIQITSTPGQEGKFTLTEELV